MQVVKSARVEDFLPYCAGTRLSKVMQRHVALFLAKLSGATNEATVKYLCVEEKGWFDSSSHYEECLFNSLLSAYCVEVRDQA